MNDDSDFEEYFQHHVDAAAEDDVDSETGLLNGGFTCYQNILIWAIVSSDAVCNSIQMNGQSNMVVDQHLLPAKVAARHCLDELVVLLWTGETTQAVLKLKEL